MEVGISAFYFYRSERSQKMNISEKKQERLQKILEEAVEQSGRNIVPTLEINVGSADLQTLQGMSIFLHTKNSNSLLLKDYISLNVNIKRGKINIFI